MARGPSRSNAAVAGAGVPKVAVEDQQRARSLSATELFQGLAKELLGVGKTVHGRGVVRHVVPVRLLAAEVAGPSGACIGGMFVEHEQRVPGVGEIVAGESRALQQRCDRGRHLDRGQFVRHLAHPRRDFRRAEFHDFPVSGRVSGSAREVIAVFLDQVLEELLRRGHLHGKLRMLAVPRSDALEDAIRAHRARVIAG